MPSQTFFPTDNEGYRIVLDSDEHEIYLGHKFSAFYKQAITGTTGTSIITITSNSDKLCNAWFAIETDKSGMYEVFEGATISGGSVLTSFNNNRNSLLTSDAIVTASPSVATVGTLIGGHIIGSTTGGASKSGGSASVNKYQLKMNTTYALRFTADADNTRVTHSVFWRELNG